MNIFSSDNMTTMAPDMTIAQAEIAGKLRDALDSLVSGRTDAARREIESLLKDLEEKKLW